MTMFQIGQSLRDTRLGQGIELSEVEQATLIRSRYLAALETERFDLLPGEAYARAFLREYAEYLGLDPTPFLDELDTHLPDGEPVEFVLPSLPRRGVDRRRLLAFAAAAAAVAIGVLAWKSGGGPQPRATVVVPPAAPQPAAVPRRAQQIRHPQPVRTRLALVAARGPVWLSIRAGSGQGHVLYESTLEPGHSLTFARGGLWIRIGAPWNLDLRVNGHLRPVPSSTAPENVVLAASGQMQTLLG
jgi:hypothetical protein